MPALIVELSQEQYDRYKAAYKKIHEMTDEPSDEMLIAQLRREAGAVTYAAETQIGADVDWTF